MGCDQVPDLPGVGQHALEPLGLQRAGHRLPVVAGCFLHIDAAHPVPVQRLVRSPLPRVPHLSLPGLLACCKVVPPGEPGGERRKLTRVLVATMNGPLDDRLPASG